MGEASFFEEEGVSSLPQLPSSLQKNSRTFSVLPGQSPELPTLLSLWAMGSSLSLSEKPCPGLHSVARTKQGEQKQGKEGLTRPTLSCHAPSGKEVRTET